MELGSQMPGEARKLLFCRTTSLTADVYRLECQIHDPNALHLSSGKCWGVWVHIRFSPTVVCVATRSFGYCILI